ncbi:MAG: VOC family protein [Pseudomonadota bacterium]
MSHAKAGTLGWVDLTVSDAARARDFYAAVCDLTPRDHAMGDYADFDMIGAEGAVVTGVCHAKGANAGVPPVWIPYFTVAALDGAVAEATRRGATLLDHRPMPVGLAILRDPDGATFGLLQAQGPSDGALA